MSNLLGLPGAPMVVSRQSFSEALRDMQPVSSRRRNTSPEYIARLAEAAAFMADVVDGSRPATQLLEALTTSDFPLYFGDVLDRQVLANYRAFPATWSNYIKRGTVRDFRASKRFAFDGLDNRLVRPTHIKAEGGSVVEDNNLNESSYTISVEVFERGVGVSWRTLINDDLDVFADIPRRLALAAKRTEEYEATALFVDANGPHASLYTSGNTNIVTGNPVLSMTSLAAAILKFSQMTQPNGEPIIMGDALHLVVPPALMTVAANIVDTLQFETNENGGEITGLVNSSGVETRLIVRNWISRGIKVHVNPYIPVVASGANGDTSWFLFTNPNDNRPAVELAFLRGYEEPMLLQKAPNTQSLSGQPMPEFGDFDTMERRWKVLHILGGTIFDGRGTVASNGSGS